MCGNGIFWRQKDDEGEKSGAGLGLAIARRILELHGSELTVHSVLGKGATFIFDLPAYKPK